jgi:hypothetical protein
MPKSSPFFITPRYRRSIRRTIEYCTLQYKTLFSQVPEAAQKFGRPGEGRRNREIAGALIFARVKRTADEGRKVVKAEEILAEILEKNEKGGYVEVKDKTIEGDLDLSEVALRTVDTWTTSLLELGDEDEQVIVKKKFVSLPISITNSEIRGFVKFGNIIFDNEVNFLDTTFNAFVSFGGTQFHKNAIFEKTVFKTESSFMGAKFDKEVSFKNAQFCKSTKFGGSKFDRRANFSRVIFENATSFMRSRFSRDARFTESHFGSYADFSEVRFGKYTYFTKSIFNGDYSSFDHANFGGKVSFDDAEFIGNVGFNNARFSGNTDFKNTKFGSGIREDAYFPGSRFSGFTNFKDDGDIVAQLNASFQRSEFSGDSYFESTKFYGEANFSDVRFGKDTAKFQDARFTGNASFKAAIFPRFTNFDEVWFKGDADFAEARFTGDSRFYDAHFDKKLNLTRARIDKMALNNSQFKNESEILLKEAIFNRLYLKWGEIKTHLKYRYDDEYDWATYSALVKNFRDLVRYDDADDCYYEFRKKHQNNKKWFRENASRLSRFNGSKLYDHIAWRSCGYGVRPDFTIACVLGIIFIFSLLFWDIIGVVLGQIPKFSNLELDLVGIFDYIKFNLLQICVSFLDHLYLSTKIFIGQTPSDFEPVGFLKFAAIIEGILGYLFLALFIVVLARKFIR